MYYIFNVVVVHDEFVTIFCDFQFFHSISNHVADNIVEIIELSLFKSLVFFQAESEMIICQFLGQMAMYAGTVPKIFFDKIWYSC